MDGSGARIDRGPVIRATGMGAPTPIATPAGWRVAAELRPGDLVLCLDGPPQAVSLCHHATLTADLPVSYWPLLVPAGALDNRTELRLLPEQTLLIEHDLADDLFGDPFALLPVLALDGWRGIIPCHPEGREAVVSLAFAAPQIIHAGRGVMLGCPGRPAALRARTQPVLTMDQARHLIGCIRASEIGQALRAARGSQAAALWAPNRR